MEVAIRAGERISGQVAIIKGRTALFLNREGRRGVRRGWEGRGGAGRGWEGRGGSWRGRVKVQTTGARGPR